VFEGRLTAVRVIGQQELTTWKKARDEFILLALRGEVDFKDARFLRLLWLLEDADSEKLAAPASSGADHEFPIFGLDESQMRVLWRMTSEDPVVIVQGELERRSCMIIQ
jgi:hypothetical protein